jgi:ribosome-associated heat shock protein Hsp15
MGETRVDQWLWAVRIYKTRTAATNACRGGHVRINGRPAQASGRIRPGDRVTTTVRGWVRDLEVVREIARRVGGEVAAGCFVDHSPPRPKRDDRVPPAFRAAGSGRPTKRDRRVTDRLRNRPT